MHSSLRLTLLASLIHLGAVAPAGAAVEPRYQIPASSLAQAATQLSVQAGVTVHLADDVSGTTASGRVDDAATPWDALTQMLAGTGLTWAQVEPGVIEICGAAHVGGGEATLSALQVEGVQAQVQSGLAPLDGFGLGAGINGSSDATATEGSGSLTSNGTSVASKMPLSFKETPQTVTVVTSEQFKQQNMTNVSEALSASPGVTLSVSSKGRPAFLSRGFEIETYQVDGGAPLQLPGNSTLLSTPDLSAYDHIEVLRGASALYGGAGDPGGVVNLQRKRPLDRQQVIFDVSAGSWDHRRGQLDVSSPLGFDDRLRGRVVIAQGNNDHFYDDANREQSSFYGVLEAELTPDTLLRGGLRYQFLRDDSPNVIGLPRYGSGKDLKLSRSTTFSAPWAYTDEDQVEKFLQLEHLLNEDWTLKADYTASHAKANSRYPDFGGFIAPDRNRYTYLENDKRWYEQEQTSIGVSLAGKLQWLGLQQSLVVGTDYAKVKNAEWVDYYYSFPNAGSPVDVDNYDDAVTGAFPAGAADYGSGFDGARKQRGVYANLALELIEGLHLNVGARQAWIKSQASANMVLGGLNVPGYDQRMSSSGDATRSVGLIYDFTETYSGYISYADIITPNDFVVSRDGSRLPPERGKTYEIGIKASYADSLNASLAYFVTRKAGVAVQDGQTNLSFCCSRPGGEIDAEGIDLLISGALTPRWQVNAGYTYTETRYNQAYDRQHLGTSSPFAQSQQPRHQFKLWTAYQMPGRLEGLEVSGGVRVESERGTEGRDCAQTDPLTFECTRPGNPFAYTQPLYAVADVRLGYRLDEHWDAAFSVTNLTDKRYYATAGATSSGNYYGEPRKLMFSLRAQY